MSTTRLVALYKVKIKKQELEILRYGRRLDGSRAPEPFLAPFKPEHFLRRAVTLSTPTKEEYIQDLFPLTVKDLPDSYEVEGLLRSRSGKLTDQEELNRFTQNNQHRKVSEGIYEFDLVTCELSALTQGSISNLFSGLFNRSASPIPHKTIKEILHEKTQVFFSDNNAEWKYHKESKTAYIIYHSVETLQKVVDYFLKAGIDKDNLRLTRTEQDQPMLKILSLDAEKIKNLQPAVTPQLR